MKVENRKNVGNHKDQEIGKTRKSKEVGNQKKKSRKSEKVGIK